MIRLFLKFLKNPPKFYRNDILPIVQNHKAFLKAHAGPTAIQNSYISKLSRYKIKWDNSKEHVVLAQSVSDYEMCLKIASSSHKLATEKKANIAIYSAEHTTYYYNSVLKSISTKKFKTTLDKIYLSFAGKLIYRNNQLFQNQLKINEQVETLLLNLKTKADVLNIEIENIKVGDLIYDTYLRYANQPELNLFDPFFKTLLFQTFNIFYVSKQKLEEYKVVALVSTYTTYIYHGLVVRLCLNKNIPVYTVGAYYSLVHKVLKEYPSHANNHFLFKKLFENLDNKEEIINNYKALFEKRFQGEIDSATTYMKESAFSSDTNSELTNIDWKNTVVVLAHCFFDSPHIYRDLLFPDFYDWLNFTLDELTKQKDLTILVKQHPNGLPQNDYIFEALKEKYKGTKILFINKKTSQLQIINSKPKAIITAYGTAAAEFSYKGFPVITIYDNPFTAYDFTYLAKSINEYKLLLADVKNINPKQNQKEIIEYYYMQYFFFLQGREIDYLKCAKYKGQTFSDEFLKDYLPNLNPDFFKNLDSAIEDGFKLIEWETKIVS
ncbi:MAG: hypothetical protein Q8T03_07715 [Bacteroidota bacterium]|nr:hypothetical protein [Bacteroidota bacterium]